MAEQERAKRTRDGLEKKVQRQEEPPVESGDDDDNKHPPLVTEEIPLPVIGAPHKARLLKKSKSLPLFIWFKQAQTLRKKQDGLNAIKLFKYNVEQGLIPEAETTAMLFSTIEAAGSQVSLEEAAQAVALVRKTNPILSENSLFCMLRLECLQKTQLGLENALQILQDIKDKFKVVVRDYTPLFAVLRHLNTPAHLDVAFTLLAEIKASKYDILECHFLDVLALATETRCPRGKVFDLLMDFNEVIFRPSQTMLDVLEKWFVLQCEVSSSQSLPGKGVVGANGVCSRCSRLLQSIDLTDNEFDLMLGQINVLLEKGGKKLRNSSADRVSPFQNFATWLTVNGPFDVVIDGANVGYFQWRPRDGNDILNYTQIDQIWSYWRREGKRVLVVLHERHLDPEKMAQLPKYNFQGVIEKLKGTHSLFLTPKGSNDDWYWLYAGLVGTRCNRRMFMITNDQMRDHHFATLSTRHFVKWRARHMVRYGFEGGNPTFQPPPLISYQSQVERNEQASFWHFPKAPTTQVEGVTNEHTTTAAQALATTVVDEVEDLTQVEWLCASLV